MNSYFSIVQVHFVFLLIKFHCTFFIPYKILPNYIYYIAFRLGSAHASLLTVFVRFFVLFHSCCPNSQVFGKTLVHT